MDYLQHQQQGSLITEHLHSQLPMVILEVFRIWCCNVNNYYCCGRTRRWYTCIFCYWWFFTFWCFFRFCKWTTYWYACIYVSVDTTSTFTITATDDESQTNSRQFNLIVLRPVYVTQINQSLMFDGSTSVKTGRNNHCAASTTYTVFCMWIKDLEDLMNYEYFWSNGNRGSLIWISGITDKKCLLILNLNFLHLEQVERCQTWMHVVFQNNVGTVTVWVNGIKFIMRSTGVALDTTTNATHIGRYYAVVSTINGVTIIITMVTWQTITSLMDWQKHQQILQQNIMVYGHLSHIMEHTLQWCKIRLFQMFQ